MPSIPDADPVPVPAPAAPGPAPVAADAHPLRPRASAALLVLATLAVGYTLWAAQEVILPILLAMFFALIGNPVIRLLRRLYVPRFLAALLVLLAGLTGTGALGMQLVGPATDWAEQAPREARKLGRQLQDVTRPMHEANRIAEDMARAATGEASRKVQVVRTRVDDPYAALARTPRLAASVLAVALLTFFFMVYGENLQRNAIALLPGRQQKKFTVEILHAIEREVSRYVLTISLINAVVGLAFAGILYLLGFPPQEALLWGTVVMLLNYAPYVGPLIGACLMLLVGFIAFDETWRSLLPAALYLLLHLLEGQVVTPIVLGRRMALSPLVLILALMLFGSLWGMIGLLLAVPLLVCVKLVLAQVDGMHGWARLLE
ncbi:AI-2E family transporter [Pseudoxanthomonas broegbernensis]|uniref:AI-2E family transporter n=1 Tax=Pseudoxanthomonas broegbernensis TaxID=83619 RepID=A0A7V8K7C5_9GAMM|nr:AI-2E family transporter [Pseudoxanthomonas broegbernensis]KAF1686705.1 AI-2E family transporter [Pseudoxanthomonas broegbernensis]MBB6063531.1 putative PurR-regulated permease PerM [Pseudoxanthomonas broegbernensis]